MAKFVSPSARDSALLAATSLLVEHLFAIAQENGLNHKKLFLTEPEEFVYRNQKHRQKVA